MTKTLSCLPLLATLRRAAARKLAYLRPGAASGLKLLAPQSALQAAANHTSTAGGRTCQSAPSPRRPRQRLQRAGRSRRPAAPPCPPGRRASW